MKSNTERQIANISHRLAKIESMLMAEAIADEHELEGQYRGRFMESVRSRAQNRLVSERDIRDLARSAEDRADILDNLGNF